MTSSHRPAQTVVGAQEPRLTTVPADWVSSAGAEAIKLARLAGLRLDPWQQLILDQSLRERADGSWAAFETGLIVARQNGKGGVIEARELAGLFLLEEQLILHSAHQFKTAKTAFKRIVNLIKRTPSLDKRVKNYRYTTGEESIELHSGAVLQFLARSGGSGRGFTGDCNILDEAMILGDDAMDALLPTMSAVPNPQIWYLGSAGIGAQSVVLGRLRARALAAIEAGTPDPSLAWYEWSADPHLDECPEGCTAHDDPDDVATWAKTNPALGIRISVAHIERERRTMSREGFLRERLSVGDYPTDSEASWEVIPESTWTALVDGDSALQDPLVFAVDVTPDRSSASIGVAGRRPDGRWHVEVIETRPGVTWVVTRMVELNKKWAPLAVVVDNAGPAGSLIKPLDDHGVTVTVPKGRDVAQACGQFYDAVTEGQLRHLGQAQLTAALAGAKKRPLGDAWAWARRGTSVDITPLVAVTLAIWGHGAAETEDEPDPQFWNWADLEGDDE